MIIVKSISRFARNTVDTLQYVRALKEKGVAVMFEEENINTLTMDGELLLTILSSVAQQEVQNISEHVKLGLSMKMQRGEMVGFNGCLGYDYHKEDKTITINEKEAEAVRYIFNRYVEGAGGKVIARELKNLGYKTKRGDSNFSEHGVIGIIKNEKYKGDLLMGKTFTVDPITKRRLDNMGEADQYYTENHHEAIVSRELWDKTNDILNKRRGSHTRSNGKRDKYSRQYSFSCMLKCGFCGGNLTRRTWNSQTDYKKVIWQCVTATKQGKKECPYCKGVPEALIEEAFVRAYNALCTYDGEFINGFLEYVTIDDLTDITWDRFIEIGKDVLDKTGMPMLTNVQGEPDLLNMILQSAGISVFDEEGKISLVNNDGLKEAMNVYMDLINAGILQEQTDWSGYQGSINNGTVVGTINGSWICATITSTDQAEQEGNWAVTNMPKLNDYPGATNYSAQGGSTWAISSSSKNYDLAVDFFKTTWAGSTEFYDNILSQLGAIATYLPAADSDAYNQVSDYFGGEAIYSKIVSYGSNIPTINKGIYWSEEKEALGTALTNVLNGSSDLDSAIEEAQATIEFNIGQ